jgi:hypothetical protein
MTTRRTSFTLKNTLRISFCVALLAAPAVTRATVLNWHPSTTAAGPTKEISRPDFSIDTQIETVTGTDLLNQLSFKTTPESQATNETSGIGAAALSGKLQARDTDFDQVPPSVISSNQVPAMQSAKAFDAHLASVPSYQSILLAPVLGHGPSMGASLAGGHPVPVPEMSAFFPIIGLLVAVSCTRILRRRKATQLSTQRRSV